MVFEAVGRTMVVIHNQDFPSDQEWDAYLNALREHVALWKDRRSLVVTEGGAPSSHQRSRMFSLVGESRATTAVISSSTAVRATVGALHLQNPAIKAFTPNELDAGIAHLNLRQSERDQILARLPVLRRAVGTTG